MKRTWMFGALALAVAAIGCGGGGGGGGTGGSKSPVQGYVLSIETGSGPNPQATVTISSDSTSSDLADGFFSFNAPVGATSATVVSSFGSTSFTFDPIGATADLGDLYVGPATVTVRGKAIDSSNGSPIGSAKVRLAGRTAVSAADGTFSLTKVAYSGSVTNVFFGLDGVVTADLYFVRHFNPSTLAVGGTVDVGSVELTPLGSSDPPPPPFDLKGTVLPSGQGGGATVKIKQGAIVLRSQTVDTAGTYQFWLPTGAYTLEATKGAKVAQVPINVSDINVIKTVNVTLP